MAPRSRITLSPSIVAAVVATMVLSGVYVATAAPDLTLWDAPEFIAAAHTLGIPHPPGTPLWVLLGKVATFLFGGRTPTHAVTMLSVVCTALAGGISAWLVARWVGLRAAIAGAVMAGTMYSVWNNATETEVYAASLLWSLLLLLVAAHAGDDGTPESDRRRARGLLAFGVALAVALHLSALVVVLPAVLLAWRAPRPTVQDLIGWIALALLGLSAVAILPLLSARGPALDAGHPVTLEALLAVLRREQYAVAGLWPRRAPYWVQLGNVGQWLDWQAAFGVHPRTTASPWRTAFTVAWVAMAVVGVRSLWQRRPRYGMALALLVVCGTVGVATWLNLRAGPSFGEGVLPVGALHEARERDYFFTLGFWGLGLSAGIGLVTMVDAIANAVAHPLGNAVARGLDRESRTWGRRLLPAAAALPLLLAAVPALANWRVVDRGREPMASLPRVYARALLESVPMDGVLVTGGDNDSFPLWYLQQVESIRPDVRVVVAPLLPARWYREALVRDGLLDLAAVPWRSQHAALAAVMTHARRHQRALRVSTLLDRRSRVALDPAVGWALEGLGYAPSPLLEPGTTGLDLVSLQRQADRIPPSALTALPDGVDPAVRQVQQLLRCTGVRDLADGLLVSTCSGF